MRVLLTGSSGWLGRFLAPRLRFVGHEVFGLDAAPGPATNLIATIADRVVVDRVFADYRPEAVVHAAALHKPDIARYPAQAFIDTNITGTQNLLEASVAHSVSRFIFTSTTSLMISDAIRAGEGDGAIWIDESLAPLTPRNIYGVTKHAAEQLCRLIHAQHGLPVLVLRTGRFFPEDDDTHRALSGENMKANELLHRRLTVEDAAEAHLVALEKAPELGFDVFILSAPTPLSPNDRVALKHDAPAVIARLFPHAPALYQARGWVLPTVIDRVYDASRAERALGFRCRTDFASVLAALEAGGPLPFVHDESYTSPLASDGKSST